MRMWVQSLASLSGLRIQCCHKLQCRLQMQLRCSSDVVLPWLGCRPATAAPIRPLAPGTSIYHGCNPKKKKRMLSECCGMKQVCLTIKPSIKARDMCHVIKWKIKWGPAFKFSKIMILRTKERNLRERWLSKVGDPHYMETWDNSMYFSRWYHPSADLKKRCDSPSLTP